MADKTASTGTPKKEILSPERSAEFLPDIKIKRLEIKRFHFYVKHLVENNLTPFVMERKNLNLLIENFDTRMNPRVMETRLKIIQPGQPLPFQLRAKLNPGVTPLTAEGVILVHQQDLRLFSPYAFHKRGLEIRGGKVDVEGTFSLRENNLQMKVKAKLSGLNIRSTRRRRLIREISRATENLAFGILRQRKGNIEVNFELRTRVDFHDFNIYEDLTESLLLSVFTTLLDLRGWTTNLGGRATDTFRNIIESVLPRPSQSREK
jgi:hypothetical protein